MPLIGAGAGLYLFFRGFLLLQRKRLIQNIAISKVRSASLGLVEVSGLAAGPYTMPAPITSMPCFCYRTVAWQEKGTDKDRSWEIVAEEKLHLPFFLDDNTGKLLVDPTGAELDLHRAFQEEFSDSIFSTDSVAPQNVRNFLMRHGVNGGRKTRIDEFCIKPRNFLFILGTLAENPGLAVTARARPLVEKRLIKSTVGSGSCAAELALPSLPKTIWTGPWKNSAPPDVVDLTSAVPAPEDSAQMTQQAKIAAALQRAGIAMPDIRKLTLADQPNRAERTWSSAPLAIKNNAPSASSSEPTDGKSQATEFDLRPPVVLMKGKANTDYLISWRDQRKVVSSMQWKSVLMIWGGPALTLFCLYVLAGQFGWL